MTARARVTSALEVLEARQRRRNLQPARGLDFASNDYLGLADSAALRQAASEALARGVPLGAGGSRLLRGNHPEHHALEEEAARFFGSEAALLMGGGFQANQALFATLPAAGDLILHDALIHASAHEGMRLGRADTRSFAHNDVAAARDTLRDWRAAGNRGQVWIAVESVYSMEGDLAPLSELAVFARAEDAVLVVDEAHATGVFGPSGRGLAHGLDAEVLSLHTGGKALGLSGGLICGARCFIDLLITRARPFIYATAPAPFTAALLRAALRILAEQPDLQAAAQTRMAQAHQLARQTCGLTQLASQIIPIPMGADARALHWARALQDRGFDLRAIRPPTVPKGQARLRLSITGNVSDRDIEALFATLQILQQEEMTPCAL